MFTKIIWFLIYLTIYTIISAIISGIVGYFNETAGIILLIILLIWSLIATVNKFKKKAGEIDYNRLIKKTKYEIQGFDQALNTTLRYFR